ncbi:MAG TPA: hypothetical protein H9867_01630 [Candidatus Corynebacterium gallistercoris]|uniref:Uncharacterized protein n=1 Tax=Candidatus Corynebacterium gallistercoris TaxID=2838530 RepID=A0A9D1RVS2_9CORY|nr:hypothetical protein [Candidatus Corynebacterium gallistercoris]
MSHTPTDSLLYLRMSVATLVDAAQEQVAGINTPGTPEVLPHYVSEGLEMLDHVKDILRYEAALHGATVSTYSTGRPVRIEEREPTTREREDGVTEIATIPVTCHPYPDGHRVHPLFRKTTAS